MKNKIGNEENGGNEIIDIPVPQGEYECLIAETRERIGDDGVLRVDICWEVLDGPFCGRAAAWDTYLQSGISQLRSILGISDTPLFPSDNPTLDLMGARAKITVMTRKSVGKSYRNVVVRIQPSGMVQQ